MSNETVNIPFKNRTVQLQFDQFEDQVDIDQLTRIDYSNLFAELITAPTLLNRVGLWKAEADNSERTSKLNRDIKMAEIGSMARKNAQPKKLSIAEVTEIVSLDPAVQNLQRIRLQKGKEAAYLDSLYWSVKSKTQQLSKIGERMNLTPEEFEKNITEGTWNGILIKARKNLIG